MYVQKQAKIIYVIVAQIAQPFLNSLQDDSFSDKVKTHIRVKHPYLTQCHMQATPWPPSPSSPAIYSIFLYDDVVTNTENKIIALLKGAGVNAEPLGPGLFAKSTLGS